MNYLEKAVTGGAEKKAIKKVLDESLNDDDFYCRKPAWALTKKRP